jgi:hypothetical protein
MDLSATGQTWRIQMTVEEYRQEVARRTADGESIEQIERELIEPAQLAQDDKDALWLYALGCVPYSRTIARTAALTSVEYRELAAVAHD